MHWYNISDGALVQSDRITFNALGNSTSAEFYQYPNQNGWMSYPDDNYTIFYNGILTVTDIYFGLALPFDVITVDDTIFYGTAGTYNLELIRQ